MFNLHDVVTLTRPFEDVPEGSEGTVLILYADAGEVEFSVSTSEVTYAVPLDSLKLVWKAPVSDA